ncbi:hypothetical protein CHU98_g11877, partial [Xylaria longipes]
RAPIAWLVLAACRRILAARSTGYAAVLDWLDREMAKLATIREVNTAVLGEALEDGLSTARRPRPGM